MSETNVAETPTEQQPAQDQKPSATCGCIFLVVILAVIVSLSFWACNACGGHDAPTAQNSGGTVPTSQVPSDTASVSPSDAASISPSEMASATPSPSAPSPVAQYPSTALVGSWVSTRGSDIDLKVLRNGADLSAVLTLASHQPAYLRPTRESADTYRAKAAKLTDGYVHMRFEDKDTLTIWFTTSGDGARVQGTLHPETHEPVGGGGGGVYGGGGQSTGQTYTMAQYSQLAEGMTFTQVDAIMGGGGIMVAQEGVSSMLVYQNIDAAGSQITCSFEYDILVDYSEEGL